MTNRHFLAIAVLACSSATGCGGQFSETNQTSEDGGATGGQAGSGGSANGGSANGGSATGGVANTGGASHGGAAGSRDDAGAACPATAPSVGSPCPSGLRCTYGSICCGGGYVCGPNGTWQTISVDCACIPPMDAAPYSCGTETCSSTEVCVHPANNFCGPQPLCVPSLDGGACPTGTTFMQFCSGSSSGGCVAVPKPVPPHCAPMPSSCGGAPTCACLPSDICGPSGADVCVSTQARDVTCLCEAP